MLARGGTAVAIGVPAPDSTVTLAWGDATSGAAYPNKATLKITDGGDPCRRLRGLARRARRPAARTSGRS